MYIIQVPEEMWDPSGHAVMSQVDLCRMSKYYAVENVSDERSHLLKCPNYGQESKRVSLVQVRSKAGQRGQAL